MRLCLTGVPDRRAAVAFYWLFVVAMCVMPVLALTGLWHRPVAVVCAPFLAFATWSSGQAIRWLDRHGWDTPRWRRPADSRRAAA